MTETQFTSGKWHWNNDDENNSRELVSSDGAVILVAGPNMLAYDQDLIKKAPELFRTLDEAPSPTPDESAEKFLTRYKQWNLSRLIVMDEVICGR